MSNVISINTLAGQFASETELQTYCDKQFKIIETLTLENQKLKEEIDHLKYLVASTTEILTDNIPVKIIVSKEQALLENQISILHERSLGNKELSLEETKKLDLLLKNLNILKNQEPTFDGKPKKKLTPSVDTLLEMASKKIDEPSGAESN